jgi:hypothetical protein
MLTEVDHMLEEIKRWRRIADCLALSLRAAAPYDPVLMEYDNAVKKRK